MFFDLSLVKKFSRFILIMPLDISFYRIFYLSIFFYIAFFPFVISRFYVNN